MKQTGNEWLSWVNQRLLAADPKAAPFNLTSLSKAISYEPGLRGSRTYDLDVEEVAASLNQWAQEQGIGPFVDLSVPVVAEAAPVVAPTVLPTPPPFQFTPDPTRGPWENIQELIRGARMVGPIPTKDVPWVGENFLFNGQVVTKDLRGRAVSTGMSEAEFRTWLQSGKDTRLLAPPTRDELLPPIVAQLRRVETLKELSQNRLEGIAFRIVRGDITSLDEVKVTPAAPSPAAARPQPAPAGAGAQPASAPTPSAPGGGSDAPVANAALAALLKSVINAEVTPRITEVRNRVKAVEDGQAGFEQRFNVELGKIRNRMDRFEEDTATAVGERLVQNPTAVGDVMRSVLREEVTPQFGVILDQLGAHQGRISMLERAQGALAAGSRRAVLVGFGTAAVLGIWLYKIFGDRHPGNVDQVVFGLLGAALGVFAGILAGTLLSYWTPASEPSPVPQPRLEASQTDFSRQPEPAAPTADRPVVPAPAAPATA